jgi:hypothetical protein
MKNSSPLASPYVQLDPTAFVADPQLIRALDERSTPVPCDSDRPLFRQGEPAVGIFILHRGVVTLSMLSKDGHSLLAAQARPGSILGLPGAISNEPYTITATAGAGAKVKLRRPRRSHGPDARGPGYVDQNAPGPRRRSPQRPQSALLIWKSACLRRRTLHHGNARLASGSPSSARAPVS